MKVPFYDWYRETIRNSKYRWVIIIGTLIYLLSPFDLLPDFIPLIGQIDDTVVLGVLIAEISGALVDRIKAQKSGSTGTVGETTDSPDTVEVDATTVK